jgi:hypothetical protein
MLPRNVNWPEFQSGKLKSTHLSLKSDPDEKVNASALCNQLSNLYKGFDGTHKNELLETSAVQKKCGF